jgi:fumarate hydratase class II
MGRSKSGCNINGSALSSFIFKEISMRRMDRYRLERDSMGTIKVPSDALWGAQTQRALNNFFISGIRFPRPFIRALGLIKWASACANEQSGRLERKMARAIQWAAQEVAEGRYDAHFPVDVFQTGSGTSTNMNANEVIATLASRRLGRPVHPNDHVNMSQSSNDVIPTAIHLSAALELTEQLLPALEHLRASIDAKASKLGRVVKTGRTHLMDAMPIRMDQEMSGWSAQISDGIQRLYATLPRLLQIAIGGTAVGTGVNAPKRFGSHVAAILSKKTGLAFRASDNFFKSLSSQDAAVELSGQLKTIAVAIFKIANDLRWMNSGPFAGLGEIELPALQPGSSIMPGKVNPVIPEAVAMACVRVMGNDTAIAVAGASGNFQLNVMLPLVALGLLESLGLLTRSARSLADLAIAGFKVRNDRIAQALEKNPILVTALNPIVGYDLGARIAKKAYTEGRPLIEVAKELTGLPEKRLRKILDPARLT